MALAPAPNTGRATAAGRLAGQKPRQFLFEVDGAAVAVLRRTPTGFASAELH